MEKEQYFVVTIWKRKGFWLIHALRGKRKVIINDTGGNCRRKSKKISKKNKINKMQLQEVCKHTEKSRDQNSKETALVLLTCRGQITNDDD